MRLMWDELLSSRELIWRLFVRDFSTRYRQSLFGVVWALITPVVTAGVFIGMSRSGILNIGDIGVPYPLYALIGISIWNIFSGGLTACAQALVAAGNMVEKINFPKVALLVAATGQCLVDFSIRMVLIGLAFIYFGVPPRWGGIALGLISLIPIYLFMIGIGFVLSLATAVLRDISNALNIALLAALLLTPVLYPIKNAHWLPAANNWNPLNYLVNAPRDFIIMGHAELSGGFLLASLFSLVVFYMGWKLFYLAQMKIAERI